MCPVKSVLEPDAELLLLTLTKLLWMEHRLNAEDVNETGGACWEKQGPVSSRELRGWCGSGGQSLHVNTTPKADQTLPRQARSSPPAMK